MFDFYEKRRLKGLLFSKITAGIVFALALFLCVSAYDRYVAEKETRDKRLERAAELAKVKQKTAALEARVEYMESERGIEEAIRQQFDMAMPGEEVVVIVDEAAAKDTEVRPERFPLPAAPSLLERIKFW
jgi:cell division protein FtsB